MPTLLQALSECESSEPQLIVEAASPCKILLANPAWCALTGYNSEDVVGNSVSLLCSFRVSRRPLFWKNPSCGSGISHQRHLGAAGESSPNAQGSL